MLYRFLLLIVLFCNGVCSANANTAMANTKDTHFTASEVKAYYTPPAASFAAYIYCGYDENEEDDDSFELGKKSSPNSLLATAPYHLFATYYWLNQPAHNRAINTHTVAALKLFVLYRSFLI